MSKEALDGIVFHRTYSTKTVEHVRVREEHTKADDVTSMLSVGPRAALRFGTPLQWTPNPKEVEEGSTAQHSLFCMLL